MDFFTGTIIYKKWPEANPRLLELLKQGPTDFSSQQLKEAMEYAVISITARESAAPEKTGVMVRNIVLKHPEQISTAAAPVASDSAKPPNPELYTACKIQADNLYKEVMNKRAELFSLARPDISSDPNFPDKIEARRELALDVVEGFKEVSNLYDRADFVKIHGYLPGSPDPESSEAEEIPDHLVKQTLDNLRKNVSKTRRKEITPERTLKIQNWEAQIKILEARWHSLK